MTEQYYNGGLILMGSSVGLFFVLQLILAVFRIKLKNKFNIEFGTLN